ncbi:MAG: hypothetical protein HOM68_05945 [Gemmatimonadetes bacterium]|jgi:S-formylglutathione hydrolase FrmB|nr:hypothetical protein [Gemmatimonadota bacterium]MBT5142737.1 hypothetical protein [Gemmatimonadota bacterium]MBT5587713.1 hypothetical protein [Gemmatimonadota bacterium]MBT5960635.1 hypothetical protein [Gemmatimonadota bacterium]MBT6630539.1 hypothetical protein [Gemmatimonadota bacterium]
MRYINLCAALLCAGLIGVASASDGRIESTTIHSPALEGNLLGDSPEREIAVLLPPGYDEQLERRYPVIYFFPGHYSTYVDALGYFTFGSRLANDIESGAVPPVIVVAADGNNKYGACYNNSPVAGHWEDYIAEDLVQYIDANYRTLPQAASRGIGGKSAGAQGAMSIALHRPDVFCAVYAMKGYMAYTDKLMNDNMWKVQIEAGEEARVGFLLAFLTAFTPNPDSPPLFIDMPYELVGDVVQPLEGVADRLWAGFPISLLDQYLASGTPLRGIFIETAINDAAGLGATNDAFSDALSAAGIEHTHMITPGGHGDNPDTAIDLLVPFFVENLDFGASPTAIESRSWAQIKSE